MHVTTSSFQYEFQALVPSMQLETVLIRMKSSPCHEIVQWIYSISASCVSRAQYYYWHTKHSDDFCHTTPQVPNVDFVPNSRAVLNEEKDCRRAF